MRPAFILSFVVALLTVLTLSTDARAQNGQSAAQNSSQAACSTAAGGTTAQNGSASQNNSGVSAGAKDVENAAKQLGSLFKKKPAVSSTTAAPSPCPAPAADASASAPAPAPAAPAANAAPVAAAPPTAAPAASPSPAPQAPAPASTLGGVQLPPAPPGGLDASKLPDIVTIHIGTPTDQVIAQLNSLYPVVRNDRGSQIWGPGGTGGGLSSAKYASTNDPPYVSSAMYSRAFADPCPSTPNGCQSSDQVAAVFSGPPEKVLVRLERILSYGSGQPTTTANLRAALAQKYGPNFTEDPPMTLSWAFDEQGKALPAPPKPVSCRGIISTEGYPPPNPYSMTSYLGLITTGTPPPLQQQLTPILRGRCSFIFVTAQINGLRDGSANQMTVVIQELPEDLRDAFAAEIHMEQAANAQANQQLKNAQQTAAPKF